MGGALPRRRRELQDRLAALRATKGGEARAHEPPVAPDRVAPPAERGAVTPASPCDLRGGGVPVRPTVDPLGPARERARQERPPAEEGPAPGAEGSGRGPGSPLTRLDREARRRASRLRAARRSGAREGGAGEAGMAGVEGRAVARSRGGPDPATLEVDEWVDPATAPSDHFSPDFPDRLPFGEEVRYFDLETTGLGVQAQIALAGIARPERGGLRIRQLFSFDAAQERALLEKLLGELEGATLLVTYNGRTFDLPFLRRRLAWHRLPSPGETLEHLDLLLEVRRRHRREWEDCSLGRAERQLLGKERTGPDVPGREVPLRFRDVSAGAPSSLLVPVTHHNRIDLTSLVALHRWHDALEARAESG